MQKLLSPLKKRHSAERLKRDTAFLVASATVAVAAGSVVSLIDARSYLLDLVSQFQLQYLCGSLCGLLFGVLLKRKALMLVGILGSLSAGSVVAPYYFASSQTSSSNNTLRVFTGNVLTENERRADLVSELTKLKPDIAVLNEVDTKWVAAIEDLRALFAYSKSIPRDDNFGIAVFSRFALENVTEIRNPNVTTPTLAMDFTFNGQSIHLIASHPLPPGDSRIAHLRDLQLDELRNFTLAESGPMIVAGDLNTTPWSTSGRRFLHESRLQQARKGFGPLATWPSFLGPFGIPIDHILFSHHFAVRSAKRVSIPGSDHCGLVAELQVAAE